MFLRTFFEESASLSFCGVYQNRKTIDLTDSFLCVFFFLQSILLWKCNFTAARRSLFGLRSLKEQAISGFISCFEHILTFTYVTDFLFGKKRNADGGLLCISAAFRCFSVGWRCTRTGCCGRMWLLKLTACWRPHRACSMCE